MELKKIEDFLKQKNTTFPADIIREIEQKRMDAITAKDEQTANLYWKLAVIYYIQSRFVSIYQYLQQKKYPEAWSALKETDLQLIILEQNFSIGTEAEDPYHLFFIRNVLLEYEKLFPYEYFICRERVVKRQKCSVCGEIVKLRGGCQHIPGKIYMGELCMHEVDDFEYLEAKVVKDPFDKYEYLQPYQPEQMNYNYGLLDGLMSSIQSPYDYWYIEIVKEKNPAFSRIGRNDKCPCGSGKKFKFCCMNDEEKMYFDHYKIKVMNDVDQKIDKPLQLI